MAELADLESIKAQELIVLKYCQGLKPDDRLYDLLIEMEPKGWEQALKVIRKYVKSQAVKAEMVDHRLEQLAKMELKQRKYEGAEEGHE